MSEQAERDFLALSALEIEQQGCLADARGPAAAAAAAVPGAAAAGGACSSLPPSLVCALNAVHGCFVLSDPAQPDCPMVYCSTAFVRMVGYPCSRLVGRNCRLLQGPGTDCGALARLREAMSAEPPRAVTVQLLNYRSDGSEFLNSLLVAPVRDAAGAVAFFAGVQLDVSAARAGAGAPPASAAAALDFKGGGGDGGGGGAAAARLEPSALELLGEKGVLAAVRVAVRSMAPCGLRKSMDAPTACG